MERVWINPDCGLKTRRWEEVEEALKNMTEATRRARAFSGIKQVAHAVNYVETYTV